MHHLISLALALNILSFIVSGFSVLWVVSLILCLTSLRYHLLSMKQREIEKKERE